MSNQREKQQRSILKQNLVLFLENKLMTDGWFTPVASGESDYLTNNLSQLSAITNDTQYGDNRIYRAPFNNWIYESGIVPRGGITAPTIPSGALINGVHKSRTDATYGHIIDYRNGQIIFDSALTGATVTAGYAYKNFFVDFISPMWINKIESLYTNNPTHDLNQRNYINPSDERMLPLILIDFRSNKRDPLQLGGGKIVTENVTFHLLGDNEDDVYDLGDVICNLEFSGFTMVDFRLDIPYMDFNGDYASDHVPYNTFKVDTTKQWKSAYFLNCETSTTHMGGIYQNLVYSQVDSEIEMRLESI